MEDIYETLPEKKVELREYLNWGEKIRDVTLPLDKSSAIQETKKLLDNETNKDKELLKRRIQKAVRTMKGRQEEGYKKFRRYIEEDPNGIKERYPLLNVPLDEAFKMFMDHFEDTEIFFVRDAYDIDDNNFIGRHHSIIEKDGTLFIDGNNAPIKTLFSEYKILEITWCVESDQNTMDEFFDELDPPILKDIEYIYGVHDDHLKKVAQNAFKYDDWDYYLRIINEVDDLVGDLENASNNEQIARKTAEIIDLVEQSKNGSIDVDGITERIRKSGGSRAYNDDKREMEDQ